ncbi:MAG: VanZ family protein [Kiloniellales bacterium]
MFERPPREREWVSWTAVVLWSCFLFAVVPFARAIQKFVSDRTDSIIFVYLVVAVVILGVMLTFAYLWRRRASVRGSYLWLAVFGGFFIAYAIHLRAAPSEALHFIEYGVLGLLLFRALSHRLRDQGIYIAACLLGTTIGSIDEAIQWLTPGRFWGLDDIWINFVAVFLIQGSIALGIRPAIIDRRVGPRSIRASCRLGVVLLLVLGASLLNTPERIAWYSNKVPFLGFVQRNASVMLEYGYLYEDPQAGVFRSRLSPEELARSDLERGEEAGRILTQYLDPELYEAFLDVYTPVSDPFLHEARVHLFRRDRYLQRAEEEVEDDPELYRQYMTIAFRENQIMERYFSETLAASAFVWPAERRTFVESNIDPKIAYDSWVSRRLVTAIGEGGIMVSLLAAIAVLFVIGRVFGRRTEEVRGVASDV